MGSWSLEIFKMAMYLAFPVAMFHMFNQPAFFEEWVTKTKREIYPPEKEEHREAIQQAIRDHREKQNVKIMEALEEIERREKA